MKVLKVLTGVVAVVAGTLALQAAAYRWMVRMQPDLSVEDARPAPGPKPPESVLLRDPRP